MPSVRISFRRQTHPPRAGLALALMFLAFPPSEMTAQDAPSRPLPPDTYADVHVETLLRLARDARGEIVEGLESYEGRMWERAYVGLSAARFRRERGLFRQERSALIRWTREGEHTVLWEGARRDVPIVGLSSATSDTAGGETGRAGGMAESLARDLSREAVPPPLQFDPGSDRMFFSGDNWAFHPLSDSAGLHYRFHSGDTLRIRIPEREAPLTLAEVRVEPRRAEFQLLTASLWFDTESGSLVRAIYRPARPFDLALEEPEDASEVPGFLQPIRAEIRHITVDHGLYEFRWWIPRRFSFEGEAQVGRWARFPMTFEWVIEGLVANEAPAPELSPGALPPGWLRREVRVVRDGRTRWVTTLVPPPETLASSPALTPADDLRSEAFTDEEIREIERTLSELIPAPLSFEPRLIWGLEEGMTRFNRVEGLSTGAALAVPLPRGRTAHAEVRIGVADLSPNAELRLRQGNAASWESVSLYRRLAVASEWSPGHSLSASVGTLLFGEEWTPWYRALGGEAAFGREGRQTHLEGRLFWEAQSEAVKETDFHLWNVISEDSLPPNIIPNEGEWYGASARLRWQSGIDPNRPRLSGSLRAEGGGGSTSYGRVWASSAVTFPLLGNWAGALEGGAGTTVGSPPYQRQFFPGGPAIFRATRPGERAGEAFWFGRAELGAGFPGARVVFFGDLMHLGSRKSFSSGAPDAAVGVGAAFLDGLLRADLSRGIRGVEGWRLYFYLDGLF